MHPGLLQVSSSLAFSRVLAKHKGRIPAFGFILKRWDSIVIPGELGVTALTFFVLHYGCRIFIFIFAFEQCMA